MVRNVIVKINILSAIEEEIVREKNEEKMGKKRYTDR